VLSDIAARVVMENTQDVNAGIITVVHTVGKFMKQLSRTCVPLVSACKYITDRLTMAQNIE